MFDSVLPYYMLCGMTYDEFWYGDPFRAVAYRKADRLRIERANQQLWMQGLYFHNAVSVALNNAFSKQKLKYIKEPLKLFEPTEEEKKAKIEETRRKLVNKLNAFKDAFDKAKGNKQ